MDLFANVFTQRFAATFRHPYEPYIVFTQNNNQPLRLYLVRPSLHPGSSYPLSLDPSSGDDEYIAFASLRDIDDGFTLASTAAFSIIRDGFAGILNINTPEIAAFLAGRFDREVAFCVDLTDSSGNKTTPFGCVIVLRATDAGALSQVASQLYFPQITGFVGGGSTNLDGVVTVTRGLGTLIRVIVNIGVTPVLSEWRLEEGLGATDLGAGIVQPLDHDPITNPRVLVLVSGAAV